MREKRHTKTCNISIYKRKKFVFKRKRFVFGLCLLVFFGIGCNQSEYIEKKYKVDSLKENEQTEHLDGLDDEELPDEKQQEGSRQKQADVQDADVQDEGVHETIETKETIELTEKTETAERVKDTALDQEAKKIVYICGAVIHPGVYELAEDARVIDAITAAGGLREDADTVMTNQARRVTDGEQIQILTIEEAKAAKVHGDAAKDTKNTIDNAKDTMKDAQALDAMQPLKVNINEADVTELMTLPGIGQVKAEAIVRYRSTIGNFTSITDLLNVSGIKESVFSKIKDLITI